MKLFPVTVDILDKDFDIFSRVVRGITHDYNNLLTPILAYPEIIKMDVKADSNGAQLLSSIETTAQELLAINRQLMHIITAGGAPGTKVDVADLLDSLKAKMADHPSSVGISIDVTCKKGLCIECSYDDVLMALSKIAQNACESMGGKGITKFHAEKVKLSSSQIQGADLPDAKHTSYVAITVADTGQGIDTKHMNHIFEPFFTTKKTPAKRTVGLGLTLAYRLITVNGGLVEIDSEEGKGTTVKAYFQAC